MSGAACSRSVGGWWMDVGKPRIDVVAAHLVNVAWNGLSKLDIVPGLATISDKKGDQPTLIRINLVSRMVPFHYQRGGPRRILPLSGTSHHAG